MRLSKQKAAQATKELLAILAAHPEGMSTKALSGTPKFHGVWTLRNRLIIKLLNESGKAESRLEGEGKRTYYVWRLKQN